jgi:phosphatidylglycerol:prolipoprotein diacylglycerol transferase
MMPTLQIGPATLPLPALLLLAGFWLGLDLTEKHAPRFQANAQQIYHLVLAAMLAGLLGARLSYAMRSPDAFVASPLSLLQFGPQMLDAQGGLLFAALTGLIYGQRRHLALWPTLDALTTLLAVMLVTIGLANFASGDGFGAPANLPWAIELWGAQRHPSQVYETLAALLIAIATWPGSTLIGPIGISGAKISGLRFWVFVALAGFNLVVLQAFRGDSVLLAGLRLAQLGGWIMLAISLWQIGQRLVRSSNGSNTD